MAPSDDDKPMGLPGTIEAGHPTPLGLEPLTREPPAFQRFGDRLEFEFLSRKEPDPDILFSVTNCEVPGLVLGVPTEWKGIDACWVPRSLDDWLELLRVDPSAPEMDKRVGRPSSCTKPGIDGEEFLRDLIHATWCDRQPLCWPRPWPGIASDIIEE